MACQLGVNVTTNQLSATAYDDAGNLRSRGGFTYSYDALSMMQTMNGGGNKWTYIYTADDERIWSVESTNSPWKETFTLRDLNGTALRIFGTLRTMKVERRVFGFHGRGAACFAPEREGGGCSGISSDGTGSPARGLD